ncbi:helix-turn-helix transcriptional regulator [Asticcacaulis tiandongensis]|uniref:helix-turn-helix transcriptional regulator n=1 Tax=Asticcacaulis tiandongensis TaxID=2565365 RepID=UPI0011297F2F|nr:autoinducer binding domain-containing protein [Asticcacaulis tiandongensis]
MLFKSEGYRFEDFVEKTSKLTTPGALFEEFTGVMGQFGYTRIIFSVPRDEALPEADNRIGLMHNYPEDWQKYYNEKGFERLDPVLKAAGTYSHAFRWRTLERSHKLSERQIRFFRLGEEAGLRHGIGIPMSGDKAQIAGIAMASGERVDAVRSDLDLISAYCNQFFMSFKRLKGAEPVATDALVSLSKKETEVLQWVAAGRSDDDIGQILGISVHTVDTHLRHVYQKLEVNNRVSAVVKAIIMGLIKI